MPENVLTYRLYALIAVITAWVGAIIAGFDWGTRAVGPIPAFFFFKNTFNGDITLDRKGLPVSTKNDQENHGYGVKNTIDAVKRNAGSYSIDISEGMFQIEIFLKKRPFRGK